MGGKALVAFANGKKASKRKAGANGDNVNKPFKYSRATLLADTTVWIFKGKDGKHYPPPCGEPVELKIEPNPHAPDGESVSMHHAEQCCGHVKNEVGNRETLRETKDLLRTANVIRAVCLDPSKGALANKWHRKVVIECAK